MVTSTKITSHPIFKTQKGICLNHPAQELLSKVHADKKSEYLNIKSRIQSYDLILVTGSGKQATPIYQKPEYFTDKT